MENKKAKLVPFIILLGSGTALGVFFHTRPDWTFWQLGRFLVAFIVSLVFGLFANAQILLPILYNLPRSIYLCFAGRLRFAGILWQFVAPGSWVLGLFIFGFIAPSAADFLTGSMGVSSGIALSTVAILLSLVTPSGLNDLKIDYEKNTFARFGRVPTVEEHTASNGGDELSNEQLEAYRKAAEQGDTDAQCELGQCYSDGEGVPQDYSEAIKWYRKAAEKGNALAQKNLGVFYDNGTGVEQNSSEAVRWYRMAAEQGLAGAQNDLGVCYDEGHGVPQNHIEAVRWYQKAAKQGNVEAFVNLGLCYQLGKGVPQNYSEAAVWHRKAAELGKADSQRFLGSYYSIGNDGRQDYSEAAKWYRKAAEQGDAKAQFFLAGCYESGNGVLQNNMEAVKWYGKAAAQGNAEAQCCLGMCYANGDGVSKDVVEAYLWVKLAEEHGDERATKALDLVESLLTPEQLSEAESRYIEFQALHQQIKSLEQRIAERLGDSADEAQIKAVADKIRKDSDAKAAAALARIKARRAKGQNF